METGKPERVGPRVLLIAYACEPGAGSEPGTGWNLALQLAGGCELTVITRESNRAKIERWLAENPGRTPTFIFHDLSPFFLRLKDRGILSIQLYYALWHRALGRMARRDPRFRGFDLVHQLTFNSFEVTPAAMAAVGGRKVWGPVGGGQVAPPALLSTLPLRARIKERIRSLRVGLSVFNPGVRRMLGDCDAVLFANRETRDALGSEVSGRTGMMIDVGVSAEKFRPAASVGSGKRVLFAGRIEPRKGLGLLLLALRRALEDEPELRLAVVGDGPDLARERQRAGRLGISAAVEFRGRVSHAEMAQAFEEADVFAFPSLRDTSGAVVLEAMACGLPVIGLDHQGVAEMVGSEAGVLVPVTTRDGTVEAFARAMVELARDADRRAALGRQGRERVLREFTWEVKAERLARLHRDLAAGAGNES